VSTTQCQKGGGNNAWTTWYRQFNFNNTVSTTQRQQHSVNNTVAGWGSPEVNGSTRKQEAVGLDLPSISTGLSYTDQQTTSQYHVRW